MPKAQAHSWGTGRHYLPGDDFGSRSQVLGVGGEPRTFQLLLLRPPLRSIPEPSHPLSLHPTLLGFALQGPW